VPYRGGGPAISDLLAGHVQLSFMTVLEASGQIKSGKLRALAVTSRSRSPALPDVPSMSESPGFADYDVSLWSGVLAPAGTPEDVVRYLNANLVKVMSEPAMSDYLAPYGITALHSTSQEFARQIETDAKRWAAVVKAANVHLD